ncbi:ATP synthase subunit I [Mycoplasmatota bacterium]|nr:ATP synthase subunit I [Mycoplasmatota bacterium]
MKNKNIIERTFLFSWPYAVVFALVVYFITKNIDFVLSFILGAATSLFVNSMNYKVMKSTYKFQPEKIKSRQIWMYIGKFIFMALILYVTIQSDEYNEYYTFVGLLTFVIVAFPTAIIISLRKSEDDEDA